MKLKTANTKMFCFITLLMVIFYWGHAQAIPICEFDSDLSLERPDKEIGPTKIHVEWFLFDLPKIKTVEQSFSADFFLEVWWIDKRLIPFLEAQGVEECLAKPNQIWRSKMFPLNTNDFKISLPDVFYINKNGRVKGEQRVFGVFRSNFELRPFPLDTQILPIEFLSTQYTADELQVVYQGGGMKKNFHAPGWEIIGLDGQAGQYEFAIDKLTNEKKNVSEFAFFAFSIEVERNFNYYLWKVIVPLFLLVCISWIVFWIDSINFAVQATISSGMLLSIVAYLFSLQFLLPQISYLTKMDIYIYSSMIFVSFALLESCTSCMLANRGYEIKAYQLDKFCRFVIPILFIGINIWVWGFY